MNNIIFITLIIISVFLETSAQSIMKNNITKYIQINISKQIRIVLGIFLYALLGLAVSYTINYKQLIEYNIIWHLFHFLVIFLIGIFIFKEKPSNQQIIGITLGIISIIILMSNHHH